MGAVADIGLGANIAADGTYPQATVDADGPDLDGARDYQIDFGKDLPAIDGGYWSVTVYNANVTISPSTGNAYCDASEVYGPAPSSYRLKPSS